jgi:hypothetical protein
MQSSLPASWTARLVPHAAALVLLGCAALAGCGALDPSAAPKTEKQREYEAKVQELVKQGKNFAEIRAIMRGEEPPKKAKRTKSRAKRS